MKKKEEIEEKKYNNIKLRGIGRQLKSKINTQF